MGKVRDRGTHTQKPPRTHTRHETEQTDAGRSYSQVQRSSKKVKRQGIRVGSGGPPFARIGHIRRTHAGHARL